MTQFGRTSNQLQFKQNVKGVPQDSCERMRPLFDDQGGIRILNVGPGLPIP
jgi:hypothetical protein